MSELLKSAFDRASKLPQQEQEWIASWLIEVLESERRWDELFEKSQDKLAQMADEAMNECRAEPD